MRYNRPSNSKKKNKTRDIDYEERFLIKLDLNIDILDKIIMLIFIEGNPLINNKVLLRIKKLFDMTSPESYEHNYQLELRCFIIMNLLYKIFVKRIDDRNVLVESIKDGKYKDDIKYLFEELNEKMDDLDDYAICNVNSYISDRLKYCYLKEHADELNQLTIDIISNNYTTLQSINNKFETSIETLYGKMKKARSENNLESLNFGSNLEDIDYITNVILQRVKSPSNRIMTGMKRLNEMTNGGFERGRTYCFIGVKKGFKSGLLLNLGLGMKQYNKHIQKTSKKKPCIIYLTQENTPIETYERILCHYIGGSVDLRNYTEKEIIEILQNSGFLDGIELKVIYKDNGSISTMDLIPIIEEIEMAGYECIALIHDYLKRIRSAENIQDLRIRFGEIINEFSVIAKNKDIPIITAMQINREGQKIIETLKSENKLNLGKQLQGSHIGESALILENVDGAYIINKETVGSTNSAFITIKEVASRIKVNCEYFAQEFDGDNGMKLKFDQDLPNGKYYSLLDIGESLGKITEDLDPKSNLTKSKKISNKHFEDDFDANF